MVNVYTFSQSFDPEFEKESQPHAKSLNCGNILFKNICYPPSSISPKKVYVKYLYSPEKHKPDDDNVPVPTV